MKLSGMAGTGSGKLGSQVYAACAGEQVVRNYQPKVSNPNTEKQVNQRARMKLMSQLSAAFAPVIAIPRDGMKSSRNIWNKKNFPQSIAIAGQATAWLQKIQLTTGTAALPRLEMLRRDGRLGIYLEDDATGQVDRVVYNVFARSEEGELMLIHSTVVTDPGEDGDFYFEYEDYESELFAYAYGMKDLNSRAKAKYGNYVVESGEDIAKLMMSRTISTSDYLFTETQGNALTIDQNNTPTVPEGYVKIDFTFLGDGVVKNNSASGAVQTAPLIIKRGTQRKLYAQAAPGYRFNCWLFMDGEGTVTSYDNPVTVTFWRDTNFVVDCLSGVAGSDE